ncbi:hypothetical protein GQ44DRAFT_615513 [Phaeosphaeriaceae sp. PMI808]|nr:hypothetical protein GQ44DRAFT_615513 [Phaeosphaeriaceae sp. PMI808]
MPTDKHGVTHAGSLGLFDDEVEIAAAADRAARHERECLAEAIRRHGQHVERERRETDKAVERMAKGKNNVSWMQRLFGRGSSGDGEKDGLVDTTTTTTFKVVHRPVKPEKKYVAEDIDPVNSLWLRECGMVRVKSGDVGGCHIVPKSSIAKND